MKPSKSKKKVANATLRVACSDRAMCREKARVGLYRLYNYTRSGHGEPFAMCAYHAKTYSVPNCTAEMVADRAVGAGCFLCAEGQAHSELR